MMELCVYQTVHLCDGRPRLVADHAALVDRAARSLLGIRYKVDPADLERRIAAAAAAARYPRSVSGFVRIELFTDGRERLAPAGVSLYRGYAWRSLTPEARTIRYDLPLSEAPASHRAAAALLARQRARLSGADVAVRCNGAGHCLTADDAPLIAIRGREVVTPPVGDGTAAADGAAPALFPSVERALALRAAVEAGLTVCEEPVERSALGRFDELFYVDHRGITSLAHCDGYPFMTLLAERIAGQMEALAGRYRSIFTYSV